MAHAVNYICLIQHTEQNPAQNSCLQITTDQHRLLRNDRIPGLFYLELMRKRIPFQARSGLGTGHE